MKIISFIEDKDVIEKILRHLGLWKTRNLKLLAQFSFQDFPRRTHLNR